MNAWQVALAVVAGIVVMALWAAVLIGWPHRRGTEADMLYAEWATMTPTQRLAAELNVKAAHLRRSARDAADSQLSTGLYLGADECERQARELLEAERLRAEGDS